MTPYRTTDMEGTVLKLAAQHPRVVVRTVYHNPRKVRFRSKLVPLSMWIVRQKFGQEAKFAEHGGVVLWGRDPAIVPEHDAQLLCECPPSLNQLRILTCDTSTVAVVYYPPTWEQHLERILQYAKPHRRYRRREMLDKLIRFVDALPVYA